MTDNKELKNGDIEIVNITRSTSDVYLEELVLPNCEYFKILGGRTIINKLILPSASFFKFSCSRLTELHLGNVKNFQISCNENLKILRLDEATSVILRNTRVMKLIAPKCISLTMYGCRPRYLDMKEYSGNLELKNPFYVRCKNIAFFKCHEVPILAKFELQHCDTFTTYDVKKETFEFQCDIFNCYGKSRNLVLPETREITFKRFACNSIVAPKCEKVTCENVTSIKLFPRNVNIIVRHFSTKENFKFNHKKLKFSHCQLGKIFAVDTEKLDLQACEIQSLKISSKNTFLTAHCCTISSLDAHYVSEIHFYDSNILNVKKMDCGTFYSRESTFDKIIMPNCEKCSIFFGTKSKIIALKKCEDISISTDIVCDYFYAPNAHHDNVPSILFVGRTVPPGITIINEITGDFRLKSYVRRLQEKYLLKML